MREHLQKRYNPSTLTIHILSSTGLKIITFIIGILQGIFIARYLLPEGRGEIAIYMTTFNLVFSLLNLGIRQSSSYYLSKESFSLSTIVAVQLVMLIFSTLIGSIILILSYMFQGYFNKLVVIVLLLLFPLRLYINYTNSIALSKRWIHRFNVSQLFLVLIEFIGVLVFIVFMKKGVEYYFISSIIATGVTALFVFSWAIKLDDYKPLFNKLLENIKIVVLKGINYAIPLFIFGLNYSIDVLILQKYVSVEEVGIYTLGVSLSTLLWHIPALLGPIIFSYGVSTNNPKAFSYRLWKNTWKLMLFLVPILMILSFILPYFIPMLYGEAFSDSYKVFMYLLGGTYLMIAFKILNGDFAARGNPTAGLYIFIFGIILNIILNIILIPKMGINGAAIASTISYSLCSIAFIIRYRKIIILRDTL